MSERLKKIMLLSSLSLLIIAPSTCLAWHDAYWNYYGSGRDHPYSEYINNYYTPGYTYSYSMFEPDVIDDGLYFSHATTPAIVPLPVQYAQVPVDLSAQQNEFTVNVPNDHGGFTAVVIKRSGNGYAGPQGEYYPEFPKVSQLKLMYGK